MGARAHPLAPRTWRGRRRAIATALRRAAPRVAAWLLVLLPILIPLMAHAQEGGGASGTAAGRRAAAMDEGARLFAARRYAEARTVLTSAGKATSSDIRVPLLLGEMALIDGNGDEAAKQLERAVAAAPRNAEARWWLARAYARQAAHAGRLRQIGLAGALKSSLEAAIAIAPDHLGARTDLLEFALMAPGIVGGGIGLAREQAREIARRSAWRGHAAAGMVADKAGDQATAARELRAAVDAAPDSAEATWALGNWLQRHGHAAEAIAAYDQLLARHPGDAGAWPAHYHIGRAASLSAQGLDRGRRELELYLSRPPAPGDPSLASAWYRLGIVTAKLGDRAAARQALRRTLALDPSQDEAREALEKLGR